ncbi:hypothetical protein ACOSQ2_033310 [Xanthoceras sorbifolium]|uniref:Nucleoside phosphorylase domain-containing protein n=1 Tax=Xanthoceras sorbifolium TaxID=99658 RepID=A0ABQ8H3C5_9ROSI|nr:hypothetical protein JRO89_XS14G0018500 [Xanthoceras sorbifolium]
MAAKSVPSFLEVLVLICLVSTCVSAKPTNRIKSHNVIKELNRKGPYIGLITVIATEENAFFDTGAFKPHPKHPFVDLAGRRFWVGKVNGKKVICVRCGDGMVNAAATTQQMADLFDVKGIVHFGIAGNVNSSMSIGDVTIPKQFADTGLWDWLNPNATLDSSYVGELEFESYNVPNCNGSNLLGRLGYDSEQFYSESGDPNTPQSLLWAQVSKDWLQVAASLEGMELERCVNSTLCLQEKPKLVVGLSGSTSNIFVDNGAYSDFLFHTFKVSSADMESSAVVMTSLSNGLAVIVIRGLSDLAGRQKGHNSHETFGSLAAHNSAKALVQFIDRLYTY